MYGFLGILFLLLLFSNDVNRSSILLRHVAVAGANPKSFIRSHGSLELYRFNGSDATCCSNLNTTSLVFVLVQS